MNLKTKGLVISAITLALMIVLGGLPLVFLIPLLFACSTRGWKTSLFFGLCYGLISLLYSFLGSSLVSLAFVSAPWIAIVPRILTGLLASLACTLTKRLTRHRQRLNRVFPHIVCGIVGSVTNTGLVVALFALFLPSLALGGITLWAYIPYLLVSGAIELAVNAAALPAIVNAVYRTKKNQSKPATENI